MKLGVLGFLPGSFEKVKAGDIRQLRELGFAGTGLPGSDDPREIATGRAREVGQMFSDAGIELVEYGRYMTNLVSPDANDRRQNIENLREAFRVSKAAGCPAVITGAGSLNPRSRWYPHRDNYSREVFDRLVASLEEAVKAAEDEGVLLGLECHTLTPLKDARTARDVLDAVGSGALKIHLDPVNWMTWETVYKSGEATVQMFETLGGERLLGAHSKGLQVEDELIIHISEAVTGDENDIFDHAALLREAAKMRSDFFVVIEHLKPDQMPAARAHILKVAEQIGAKFD